MQKPNVSPSLVGQVLKDYRATHKLTQEQLANDLGLEPRRLRAWENETPPKSIDELRRIADLLGIEPERLGLAASVYIPKTPEQIEEVITHVWSLVEELRLQEARTIIERLVENLHFQSTTNDPEHLLSIAHAYHTAGYVVSEATRANESYEAIFYYKQMESIARALNNDSLLNIALTYQGDMHRRLGNITKAITYLEAARDTTPQADTAARGNGIQLLGRAYLKKGELGNFDRAMKEAEELAHSFDLTTSSTKGHYSPGTVYEEYARSYADLGQMQKALEYLDLAKATVPQTKFWELLLMTAKAMTLIKGNELRSGIAIAIDATNQSRAAGIYRFLERIYVIDQYLEKLEREIGGLRSPLRDALDGGRVTDF